MKHTFHIPVLGLGYSIDTPLKVARYGITSVISIVDDELTERMRKFHAVEHGLNYLPIDTNEIDSRAKRITAYLNQLDALTKMQFKAISQESFEAGNDIHNYFKMLPENSRIKMIYRHMMQMLEGQEKQVLQSELRWQMMPGRIDVNIMSKVDKVNYSSDKQSLGNDYTDALASMRGFANSTLESSVIISAGLNPRLYSYMENCADFYPDASGVIRKNITLKVSDFRSATIQAKMLAKKGLWVNEFRIESGLNCGGHAFATEGLLMGPILEEFRLHKTELFNELYAIYIAALETRQIISKSKPSLHITAQGGIGTADEHQFLINYYQLDSAGWGSPFLLVPEVTNVDEGTLNALVNATKDDYYISDSSPLGVLFNNFKKSTMETQRLDRIEKGRPGSPCRKKLLSTNTEFTELPICTASREYQRLKIKQLETKGLSPESHQMEFKSITDKICLCEGLCASTYIKNGMLKLKENKAVSICPGPNLVYFDRTYTLREMVDHIYGRQAIQFKIIRPNIFMNEIQLYLDYLKKDINAQLLQISEKKTKYFQKFSDQLLNGINYYRKIIPELRIITGHAVEDLQQQLLHAEEQLSSLTAKLGTSIASS